MLLMDNLQIKQHLPFQIQTKMKKIFIILLLGIVYISQAENWVYYNPGNTYTQYFEIWTNKYDASTSYWEKLFYIYTSNTVTNIVTEYSQYPEKPFEDIRYALNSLITTNERGEVSVYITKPENAIYALNSAILTNSSGAFALSVRGDLSGTNSVTDSAYLKKSGDTAGSLTVTNLYTKETGVIKRYDSSGYLAGNYTDFKTAVLDLQNDETLIITPGHYISAGDVISSSKKNVSIIGIGNPQITLYITDKDYSSSRGLEFDSFTNLYLANFTITTVLTNWLAYNPYGYYFSGVVTARSDNVFYEYVYEVTGNRAGKSIVVIGQSTGVFFNGGACVVIDIPGDNSAKFGAFHNTQKPTFKNTLFVGRNLNYDSFVLYPKLINCKLNYKSSLFQLASQNECLSIMSDYSIGLFRNEDFTSISGNVIDDVCSRGTNVIMVAPWLSDIPGVQYNSLADLSESDFVSPKNVVYVFGSGNLGNLYVENIADKNIIIEGVGMPKVSDGSDGEMMVFKYCMNTIIRINGFRFRESYSGNNWVVSLRNSTNSQVLISDCEYEFTVTANKRQLVFPYYSVNCVGNVYNSRVLTAGNNTVQNSYGAKYFNVQCFSNSSWGTIGQEFRKNVAY